MWTNRREIKTTLRSKSKNGIEWEGIWLIGVGNKGRNVHQIPKKINGYNIVRIINDQLNTQN